MIEAMTASATSLETLLARAHAQSGEPQTRLIDLLSALEAGCISLSWGRKSAMAERIEGEWSVTIASEGSQRGHPTCTRT